MQSTRETNGAFNLWLVRSLSAQYAPTLLEDVPRELLALLAEPPARMGAPDAAAPHPAWG